MNDDDTTSPAEFVMLRQDDLDDSDIAAFTEDMTEKADNYKTLAQQEVERKQKEVELKKKLEEKKKQLKAL